MADSEVTVIIRLARHERLAEITISGTLWNEYTSLIKEPEKQIALEIGRLLEEFDIN